MIQPMIKIWNKAYTYLPLKISYSIGRLFVKNETRNEQVIVKMTHLLVEDHHIGNLGEGKEHDLKGVESSNPGNSQGQEDL